MSESTSHQPYQFGDVVDGYRWTITGWEPVAAPERPLGVPRFLEKRYAAAQAEKARRQAGVSTLEPEAPVVTGEPPVVVPDDVVIDLTDDAEPLTRPDSVPVPAMQPDAEDDSDAPFAAALELGVRRLAETSQPSEVEVIATTASGASRRPVDSRSGPVPEPMEKGTAAKAAVPSAGGRTSSKGEAPTVLPQPDPEPAPHVTSTPAPAAGWYPGSV